MDLEQGALLRLDDRDLGRRWLDGGGPSAVTDRVSMTTIPAAETPETVASLTKLPADTSPSPTT